jgi:glycosyltransferase involved in cell wall biosynthesis
VIKILHITPDFNYTCGRSKLVFLYLKYFGKKDGYEVHFIANGGDSLERLKEIPSLKFLKLTFSTGLKNIIYLRKFYQDLKDYVTNHKINIIHNHHRFPEYIANKISKELNVKTVTSAHSFVSGLKKISFRADRIISVSNSVTSHIAKNFNIDEKKITTLYNPAETISELSLEEKEKIKGEMGINPEQKVLLFMGRISYKKGYDKLIQAYKIAHFKDRNIILLMCGKVEVRRFAKLRTELTIPVIIIPALKNYNMLYQLAEMIILPSRIDGFPFVMIETGMNKKAFIGGKTGGIAEFIEDGINGFLVDPDNENELAEKIIFLLEHSEIAEKLANNLNRKVKEKCDSNRYFESVEEIYNSLLTVP